MAPWQFEVPDGLPFTRSRAQQGLAQKSKKVLQNSRKRAAGGIRFMSPGGVVKKKAGSRTRGPAERRMQRALAEVTNQLSEPAL